MAGAPRTDLSDDEERQVHAIHQQIGDDCLHVSHSALHVFVDQHLLEACRHHVLHQQAVVAPDRLYTLPHASPLALSIMLIGWRQMEVVWSSILIGT